MYGTIQNTHQLYTIIQSVHILNRTYDRPLGTITCRTTMHDIARVPELYASKYAGYQANNMEEGTIHTVFIIIRRLDVNM